MSKRLNLEKVKKAYFDKTGNDLSVINFAKEMGTNHTTLYNWSKGESMKSFEIIDKIMDKTGLTYNELFQ